MLPHTHSHTRAHMHPHAGCACLHSPTAVCSTQKNAQFTCARRDRITEDTCAAPLCSYTCSYSTVHESAPMRGCAAHAPQRGAFPAGGWAERRIFVDRCTSWHCPQGTVMRRSCRFLRCANGIGIGIVRIGPNNMQSHAIFGSDASSKVHERCAH